MLAPHHRKNSQLGKVWFSAENFFDPLEFHRRETVFRHQLRSDFRIGGARHRQPTLTNVGPDTTFALPLPLNLNLRSSNEDLRRE